MTKFPLGLDDESALELDIDVAEIAGTRGAGGRRLIAEFKVSVTLLD